MPLVHNEDGAPLIAGAIHAGSLVTVTYDGTSFRAWNVDRYGAKLTQQDAAIALVRSDLAGALKVDLSNYKNASKGIVTNGVATFNYTDGTHQTIEVAGNVGLP